MNKFQKAIDHLKTLFFNGLIFLLPITLTVSIFNLFFHLVKSLLEPIKSLQIPLLSSIPHHEVIIVICLIFIMGIILKTFVLKPFVKFAERLIKKIPLINIIYSGVKQLLHAFTAHDQSSFNTIVILEFPRKGVYSFGFLTSEVPHQYSPDNDKKYVNVYIPTTPNPTTGFFVMVPQGAYMQTDLTRQEAIALVISGGILQPERYIKKEVE